MSFTQWLRKAFGQLASPARRARHRFTPKLELLEDRLAPAILTVDSSLDGSLASLAGDGKLQLREAIELAANPGITIDDFTADIGFNTVRFSPRLDDQPDGPSDQQWVGGRSHGLFD
jgi:hypothetical protein